MTFTQRLVVELERGPHPRPALTLRQLRLGSCPGGER